MYLYITVMGRVVGTYGVCMALAVMLVGVLSLCYGKKTGITLNDIAITGAAAVGFGLVFGKLLYVFVTFSLWDILTQIQQGTYEFLNGGLVFYGGLLGGILGGCIGARIARCPLQLLERAIIPYIPLGHAIGRIGCLLAGCCHGMKYNGVLAVYYPNSVAGLLPEQGYFPVQLLEAILNILVTIWLCYLRKCANKRFVMLRSYLACYAIIRFLLEFLRGDAVRGIFFGLSASQWISLLILCAAAVHLRYGGTQKGKTAQAGTE